MKALLRTGDLVLIIVKSIATCRDFEYYLDTWRSCSAVNMAVRRWEMAWDNKFSNLKPTILPLFTHHFVDKFSILGKYGQRYSPSVIHPSHLILISLCDVIVHGSLARAGKVKSQTPKVEAQEKKKTPKGRAKKRILYNRRWVTFHVSRMGFRKWLRCAIDSWTLQPSLAANGECESSLSNFCYRVI